MKKLLVTMLVVLMVVSTIALTGAARALIEENEDGEGLLIHVPAKERVTEILGENNDNPVVNNPIEVAGS